MPTRRMTRYFQRLADWAWTEQSIENSSSAPERVRYTTLEDRILFSASPVIALPAVEPMADGSNEMAQAQVAESDASDNASLATEERIDQNLDTINLLFVDGQIDDADALLTDLDVKDAPYRLFYLDGDTEGVKQISDVLADLSEVAALHIVSHGSAGEIRLGNTLLNNQTLVDYLDELTTWQDALSDDADILIYGCEVAANASGERLLADIAEATGADIAASSDLTGHEALGGDWNLEYHLGSIESAALTSGPTSTWTYLLNENDALVSTISVSGAWLSTDGDTRNPADATDQWDSGYASSLRSSDLLLELPDGTPPATLSAVFDLRHFTFMQDVNLTALHVVEHSFVLGDGTGETVALQKGDVLFSADQSAAYTSVNTVGIERGDIGMFRPQVPGDYSRGNFTEVVDDLASILTGEPIESQTITGITFVEQAVNVNASSLEVGQFLFTVDAGANFRDIYLADIARTGPNSTAGTLSRFVTLENPVQLNALELIEVESQFGRNTLTAGTILFSTAQQATVAGTRVNSQDIAQLVLGQPVASGGNGDVTASVLVESVDLGFDNADSKNDIDAFSLRPNLPVVAKPDIIYLAESRYATSDLLANDFDPDGDAITIDTVAASDPSNGTLTINSDGSATYVADPGFVGEDAFSYRISDGNGEQAVATVTLKVTHVNLAPIANDDGPVIGIQDTDIVIDVLANDFDPEGETLQLTTTLPVEPSNGMVTIDSNQRLVYVPNPGFVGQDEFVYQVKDGQDGISTATVQVETQALDQPPVAVDDTFTVNEDSRVSGNLIANDADPDSMLFLKEVLVRSPESGSVSLGRDGGFTYTPSANFHGVDSFEYEVIGDGQSDVGTVTIHVLPMNDTPQAVDDAFTGAEDTVITGNVITGSGAGADFDVDGDDLSASIISIPANGAFSLAPNGDFVFTPNRDFHGVTEFRYLLSDGDSPAAGTVTLTVEPVNDAPTANDDTFTTDQETPIVMDVLANDTDPDGDSLAIFGVAAPTPQHGSLRIDYQTQRIVYTPDDDFAGTDSFTYLMTDGTVIRPATVTVNVLRTQTDPIATDDQATVQEDGFVDLDLLANDSDPDGDPLVATILTAPEEGTLTPLDGQRFRYTPSADYFGNDSFTYQISDGKGGLASATVQILIHAVNDHPVAVDDPYHIDEDHTLTGNVLNNDTDTDGDTLTAALTSDPTQLPANGTVQLNADGSFVYTPNTHFFGSDRFVYSVSDGTGSANAAVTITIAPVNDAVVSSPDRFVSLEDAMLTGNVLNNDVDHDGDTLTAKMVPDSQPHDGDLHLNTDGTFTYIPAPNFHGTETFTYQVSDGQLVTSEIITIVVQPENDPVEANPDTYTVQEDGVLNANVLANDVDVDGDVLFVADRLATEPEHGSVTIAPDGRIVYTPDPDFFGTDTFSYHVSDGTFTHLAQVSIEVSPVADAIDAREDVFRIMEDNAITANLLQNDIDRDQGAFSAITTLMTQPSNGTVRLTEDGTLHYQPNPNFHGDDTFEYAVHDAAGGMDTARVLIQVAEVNDAPIAQDDGRNGELSVVSGDALQIAPELLKANDYDPDSDVLELSIISQPSLGSVTIDAQGNFIYTSTAGLVGNDQFTYAIRDSAGATDEASVTISVQGALPPNTTALTIAAPRTEIGETTQTGDVSPTQLESSGSLQSDETDTDDDPAAQTLAQLRGHSIDPIVPDLLNQLTLRHESVTSEFEAPDAEIMRFHRSLHRSQTSLTSRAAQFDPLRTFDTVDFQQTTQLLATELDKIRTVLAATVDLEQIQVAVSTGVTASLTVGYVVWATRAGLVLSTLLTHLPAWQLVNPICILDAQRKQTDTNRETLQGIIKKSQRKETRPAHDPPETLETPV